MKTKNLYIISGPNGAGKTTASVTILPEILECREFVNADEIAKGLSPFNPEGMAIEAGRIMLQRINELLNGQDSFAIETTLSTRSYTKLIETAHKNGFSVRLLFFYLPSAQHAIERVAQRVSEGGHNIPDDVIRRRYKAGLENLFRIYIPLVDFWTLVDNNCNPRKIIADGEGAKMNIYELTIFNTIKEHV
ncbi:MAG: zeta toxin family protein [Bacteroidales bacterium]|nr:zeta toxin family protein [Bacteroidales bacterium]